MAKRLEFPHQNPQIGRIGIFLAVSDRDMV